MLETVDLTKELDRETFRRRFPVFQKNLRYLQRMAGKAGRPVLIVLEGWDGAGKGTGINKITEYMDPRHYEVHSTVAPSTEEKMRHFLWRFWVRLPDNGDIAIYDRSWYGRVLIERVEKLAKKKEWKRAYQEINEFEQLLVDDGAMIIKFWLHISKKEQKKRFKKMEKNPLKAWKVTKEDWDHHRKYKRYLVATEEMLAKTDNEYAPWTIVECTDKRHARMKMIETIMHTLIEKLGIDPSTLESPPAPSVDAAAAAGEASDTTDAPPADAAAATPAEGAPR